VYAAVAKTIIIFCVRCAPYTHFYNSLFPVRSVPISGRPWRRKTTRGRRILACLASSPLEKWIVRRRWTLKNC